MIIGFCVPPGEAWTRAMDALEREFGTSLSVLRGAEACIAAAPTLDAVVANPMERSFYERAVALKAVFVPFVGLDHLPADLLLSRGTAVYNCHGNAESVAERALALALAGLGRIVEYHNDLRAGIWHGFWVGRGREDFWSSLYRKRCAILGAGAVGRALAGLLKAFSCRVVGFRLRTGLPTPAGFDEMHADPAAAVAGADLVFVTLPLTEATAGLVDGRLLAAMRGAFLVNVGRGPVVDERALYEALSGGMLAGAGLDVWYDYPPPGSTEGAPSRFPIHGLPNVILSPHVAGSTREAVAQNVERTAGNLALWLRTGRAEHLVDLSASY